MLLWLAPLSLLLNPPAGSTQSPDRQTPKAVPPVSTGVVPLPSGPPSTELQSPVPSGVKQQEPADRPLLWSPKLSELNGFVAQGPVTMDQAVAIALYTNRNFANAVASLVQSAARTGEARSALFPTLSVNENLAYYDKATTVNSAAFGGGGGATTSTAPPLVVLPQFNPVFSAALNLPIDLFGVLSSARSQAQFAEVASRIEVNRVRNQVVYDVKNSFYAVLRASAQVAVAQDTLNSARARLEDANKNFYAGTTSRFDIITAQRDVADAQQNLIAARSQVALNLGSLKNTMGLQLSSRLSVKTDGAVQYPEGVPAAMATPAPAGSDQNPENPRTAPPVAGTESKDPQAGRSAPELDPTRSHVVTDDFDFGPDYQDLLSEAHKYRPEILEADAQVTAGKRGLRYALRSQLPSLQFSVQDIYTANATPLERRNQEALVLDVSVPIFDGGLARERTREQHGIIAQAQVNRRNATDQVDLDVQQAYIALFQARQRAAVSTVEVAQARESFRVSQVRYRAGVSDQTGVSPQLELSNAQTSLAQAESNLVNAIYDYNSARAQLDRAVGRYGFTGIGPGFAARDKIPH